jgi:hypothetical protein
MGGGDMISSIISAIGGITSSSLGLAAAKANQKSTQIAAESGLEQAKINAEASGESSKEATKQELLKTLGIKLASGSTGAGMPGWVMGLIGVLVIGVIGFIFVSSNKGGSMPAIQPSAPSNPAPATHTAPVSSGNSNMPAHATGGQIIPEPTNV